MKVKSIKEENLVRQKSYFNPETGEEEIFLEHHKGVSKNYDFHKIWLIDLLNLLDDEFSRGKHKVLNYILKNIDYSNQFIGTRKQIVEDTKSSPNTVAETLKLLIKVDFLRRKAQSVYVVNPKYIFKGNANKGHSLLIKYHSLPEEREEETRVRDLFESA